MMNRFIYLFLLLGCAASALVGCTKDPNVEPSAAGIGEGESWVTINFGDNSFDQINITTRATLDNAAEERVGNLFVFVFGPEDETGDAPRLYGRFFDNSNRVDLERDPEPPVNVNEDLSAVLSSKEEECWYVRGNDSDVNPYGAVHIKCPSVSGGSIYLLANINSDMVNVSPEKLRFVQSLNDLKEMTASLNQQITERNGFFPMTGKAEYVNISTGKIEIQSDKIEENVNNGNVNSAGKILLTRLDAKVVVQLRVAEGYEATNPVTKTRHKIKSFEPQSWQVVNLPRATYVLPRPGADEDAKTEDTEDGKGKKKELFNTREIKFESRVPGETFTYEKKQKDENGNVLKDANGNDLVITGTVVKPDLHGFSFYMLENRHKPNYLDKTGAEKQLITGDNYHLRDKRNKTAGVYDTSKGLWEFAPEEATYLVIKGEVLMEQPLTDEPVAQQMSADVVYYIHLGDFAADVDDYNILRNTSYTYTITIYGVDSIEIEVETAKTDNTENESGATGHVYIAKEQILTFDSHFGSAVVSFDSQHLMDKDKIDDLTWYVRTPFGREGKPHIVNGVEVPAGLDYQWVQFKINSIDEDGSYSHKQEKYHPNEVMNILEFSKYIKDQKKKFDNGEANDFKREFDKVWLDWYNRENGTNKSEEEARADLTGDWYRDRIYLTIFVDEFYYDADPLTGDVRQDLWKDFVNQPHRLMHILCDAEKSKDEASLATGSVVTIRQRSIQTIFNTEKPDLMTAWGCETIDETRDETNYEPLVETQAETDEEKRDGLWYYTDSGPGSDSERYSSGGYWQKPEGANVPTIPTKDDNTSQGNGLYNTAKIWGLTTGGSFKYKNWSKYVDPEKKYGLCDGKSDDGNVIRTLRYSCMTRNRDEDGDDLIDAKEIKWYMAAISQLGSLYVGDQGLDADAVLYPYDKQKLTSKDMYHDWVKNNHFYPWRSHIVSSTAYKDGTEDKDYYPEIMWAEEGLATGSYSKSWGKSAGLSVRCVRNLGMDPATEEEARSDINEEKKIPAKAIADEHKTGDVYEFDLTNLNPLSIRYFSSHELEPNNEFSVEARPYWKFETGPMSALSYSYDELHKLITLGKSPCPEGYRVPNVREAALISLRYPHQSESSRVSTYYSHGELGNGMDQGSSGNMSKSWYFNSTQVNLDDDKPSRIRCVRDIRR